MNDQPVTDPVQRYGLLDPATLLEPPVSHTTALRARAQEIIMSTTLERATPQTSGTDRLRITRHRRRIAFAGGLVAAVAVAAVVLVNPSKPRTAFADAVAATDSATAGRFQLKFEMPSPDPGGMVGTIDYRYDGNAYSITDEFSFGGGHVTKTIGADDTVYQKFDDSAWKQANPAGLGAEELAIDMPGRTLDALRALDGMQRCDAPTGFDVSYCTSTTDLQLVDDLIPTDFTEKDSPDNPPMRSEIRADVRNGQVAAVAIDVAMTFATGSAHLHITVAYSELGQPQHIVAPI